MNTEKQAWKALVFEANRLGLRGQKVTYFEIVHPKTATNKYAIVIDSKRSWDATEN